MCFILLLFAVFARSDRTAQAVSSRGAALNPESYPPVPRAHHYGDGTVYVPRGTPRALYRSCLRQGFISEDGFVTLARYEL